MQLADIGPEARATFGAWIIDTLIEKHERYLQWDRLLTGTRSAHGPVMLTINGYYVLYPFSVADAEIVRCYPSQDGELLTIFLREGESTIIGAALVVCRRVPGEAFYATVVWHDLYGNTLDHLG